MKTVGVILLSLGLLVVTAGPAGTALGMIRTFHEVQNSGPEMNPHPQQLADNIEFSLRLTVFGFLLGVPTALAGLALLIIGVVRGRRVRTAPGLVESRG